MQRNQETEGSHEPEVVCLSRVQTPLGALVLASSRRGLLYIAFPGHQDGLKPWLDKHCPQAEICLNSDPNSRAVEQLEEYFQGKRRVFDVPLDMRGTPFQKKVWNVMTEIPCGRTWSYRDVALRLGRPRAARAVGSASRSNPIPIVVPCHRVIGSNGALTGFGAGLELKRILLEIEGVAGTS